MHPATFLLLLTTMAAPAATAAGAAGLIGSDAALPVSADPLLGRAGGPGSSAWSLVVDRAGESAAETAQRLRHWSESGAARALAERVTLSISRTPSTEGRRDRQVTVGLRLQF